MALRDSLTEIANNLWWTWNPSAHSLFAAINEVTWRRSNHNALAVLQSTTDEQLAAYFASPAANKQLADVRSALHEYLGAGSSWVSEQYPGLERGTIAYFCAEFGLHESVPLYSGGLGVLAGDHLKTASDLGIPLVAIGLRYTEGYFRQSVDDNGQQVEAYPNTDWSTFPARPVMHGAAPLELEVPAGDRVIRVRAWRVDVGRVPLYLLDTDHPHNNPHDRAIGQRLYGGGTDTRILQEAVLGVGGVRLLNALGYHPTMVHLNEGHCAFACFERMRDLIARGVSREDALQTVRSQTLFTTHTPVPAGHDRFSPDLFLHTLGWMAPSLHTDAHGLLAYGRVNPDNHSETFCMTTLALRFAERANGVSELHGAVSRDMWRELWPDRPVADVPIGFVTNGIHVETFAHAHIRSLLDSRFGAKWQRALIDENEWADVASGITDAELVTMRRTLKTEMFATLCERLSTFGDQLGPDTEFSIAALRAWRPEVLTIGFARRFATYKRGAMLFGAMERAAELIASSDRPVQFVFAGKAHPRDEPGKAVIRQVIAAARDERLRGRVLFVENYDMAVAKALISGADVWLNTPRRPLEASGTSGQKVAIHGGINASILDGWWAEGFDGTNGFAIGDDYVPKNVEEQDARDAEALYQTLHEGVVREYYDSEHGTDGPWVARVRAAFSRLPATFSTRRMLRDYVDQYYKHAQPR